MGRTISIALMAAALSLAHAAAHAAGLGRLTVLSALGQPLAAEIEIVALQAGEEDGLTARIAPAAAFRDAGIEVNPVLNSVRFSIQRRQGRPLLRVTTTQAVNEPFLELLVELQWSTGKLLREYTFLLDPPEYKAPPAIAAAPAVPQAKPTPAPAPAPVPVPVPVPEAKPAPAPAAESKPSATPEPVAPAAASVAPATQSKPAPEPEKPVAEAAETKPAPAVEAKPLEPQAASARGEDGPPGATSTPQGAPETSQYEVKRGDTLGRIAEEHLPPGVTLNQMLIAIYRANPDAFIRENVNLVRAGHILNLPPADAAGGIDAGEARRLVRAHRSDFEEYRSRLAAIAPRTDAVPGAQADAGRIEAKPEAPAAPQSSDQVRLSKADQQKPASAATRAAGADDAAARERALKEAQSRVTDLEKNVSDLQKLLELKNQQLAEMERKAAAKAAPTPPAAAAPAPPAAKAPEPVKPPAEAPKPMAQAPATPPPATPPPAPQAPVAQPSAPKPAVQPPAAKPKPKAAPPAQPTLLDEVLDHPFLIPGIAVVLILLVAYAAFAWRRKKATQARFQDSVLGAASGAGAASVFGGTPAGAATTGTGVSQTSVQPSGMSAEEVDPIAEADVYMAYGRDTQAEEILKEALAKDSKRVAVHAKLLEIYANRKDTQAFEKTALQLKALTGGRGPEWDKAVALGRSIDPQNGVYGGAAGPDATSPGFSAASAGAAAGAAAAAPALDFDLGGSSSQEQLPDISLDEPSRDAAPSSMDSDLGAAAPAPAEEPKADFTPEGTLIMGSQEPEKTHAGLDFDLGTSAAPSPAAPAADKQPDISGLDFDLNIDLGGTGEAKPPDEKSAPPPDLSAISLDLGGPAEVSGGGSDPKWQEVATKLDLAKAYDEMGDKDGARELLNEVMKDGDAAQKGQAEQLLAKLA